MPKLVITSTSLTEIAESFVEAHKSLLDGKVHYLYGGNLPCFSTDGPLAVYPKLPKRIMQRIGYKRIRKPDSPLINGIKQYLKVNKIDLVLSEFGTTGAKLAPICSDLKIPLIVHFHGGDSSIKPLLNTFRDDYRYMFKYASAIVAVSLDMKQDLINLGAHDKSVIVNPCGPLASFINIKPNYTRPHFLFIGRFVDKKAPYYLLFAFKQVLAVIPDARLTMIGDGPLYNMCENIARMLGISDHLSLPGNVPHDQLRSYLKEATCYIQHSVTAGNGDCEGTPVSILEASAAGLPVISTFHKGIKQAVVNGVTGYLVNEHDLEGMCKYMIKLSGNLDLAKQMGLNAREHVRNNYSIEKHITTLNHLIKDTIRK